MKLARHGEVALVSRRLEGLNDPIALHAALDAPLLFRRNGGRALIVIDPALRLTAKGGAATVDAISEGGRLMLDIVAQRLAAHVTDVAEARLELHFERCDSHDEAVRAAAPSAFEMLRAVLFGLTPLDREEPYALVAAGVIGFDHVDMLEALPAAPAGGPLDPCFPDLCFIIPETLLVVEPSGAARVLALAVGSDDPAIGHRQHHLAAERLRQLCQRCEVVAAPAPRAAVATVAVADLDDHTFARRVETLKQHIAAGDIFQAVPSRVFRVACEDPLSAFHRLVAVDPSAYQFCFDSGHGLLFGASPETALECRVDDGAITVSVSPIAGTRPRGVDADDDDRQEADLRLDAKEVAEHVMLVDLARNDVARVAEAGTRRVSRLLGVEKFARVMHLVSKVEGRLAEGRDTIDAIRACLNVGTLSGAPKLKAIELIRSVEVTPRGPYGGAIGWIASDGAMDSAVVIRSALVRNAVAEVRAGAGVVADSDPLAEAAETRAKASAMLAALGVAA